MGIVNNSNSDMTCTTPVRRAFKCTSKHEPPRFTRRIDNNGSPIVFKKLMTGSVKREHVERNLMEDCDGASVVSKSPCSSSETSSVPLPRISLRPLTYEAVSDADSETGYLPSARNSKYDPMASPRRVDFEPVKFDGDRLDEVVSPMNGSDSPISRRPTPRRSPPVSPGEPATTPSFHGFVEGNAGLPLSPPPMVPALRDDEFEGFLGEENLGFRTSFYSYKSASRRFVRPSSALPMMDTSSPDDMEGIARHCTQQQGYPVDEFAKTKALPAPTKPMDLFLPSL